MFLSIMSCAVSTGDSKFGRKSTDRRLHRRMWLKLGKILFRCSSVVLSVQIFTYVRKPPNKHQFRNRKLNENPRGNNFLLIGISRIVILKSILIKIFMMFANKILCTCMETKGFPLLRFLSQFFSQLM